MYLFMEIYIYNTLFSVNIKYIIMVYATQIDLT